MIADRKKENVQPELVAVWDRLKEKMMRKDRCKRIAAMLMVLVAMLAALAVPSSKAEAATDTLTIKVGFYGGPYYEVAVFSSSQMKSMADSTVYTYSAMDSGNFMRVGYAYGVTLEDLIDEVGIDLDSVKYLHFGTTDSYNEIYATFSASTLLAKRYFYPNFWKAANDETASNPVLNFSKVDSSVTAGAQRVPTILAIGSTELSRNEAGRITSTGGDYKNYSKSELSEQYKYRLMYGQKGLSNGNEAYNAQTSDKWVYEINVQLGGTPNIKVEKELISGEEGKVGSKYTIKVSVDLPSNYNYLSNEIKKSLEKQVLAKVQAEYDESLVKLKKTSDGVYEMEAIAEGNAQINFNYSRTDYGGSTTTASGGSSLVISGGSGGNGGSGGGTGTGSGSGTGNNTGSGTGNSSNNGTGNSGTTNNGTTNNGTNTDNTNQGETGINIGSSDSTINDGDSTSTNSNNTNSSQTNNGTGTLSGGSGYTWQEIGEVEMFGSQTTSNQTQALTVQASDENQGLVAGALGGFFAVGFLGSAIDSRFNRNIGRKKGKEKKC